MRHLIRRDYGPLSGQALDIDWKHPIAYGLKAFWLFDEPVFRDRVRNIVTSQAASTIATGVAAPANTLAGQGIGRTGASYTAKVSGPTFSNTALQIADQMTLAAFIRSTTSSKTAVCRPFTTTHTTPFLDFGIFTDGNFRMTNASSTSVTPFSGFALPSGHWTMTTITYDGATARAYQDLVTPGTAALTGNVHDGGQEMLFGGSRSATEDFAGHQLWNGIWNRALTRTEISYLYDYPTAFLRPSARYYFFTKALPGNYSVSLTEAASATETISAAFGVVLTEAASASDTVTVSLTRAGAIAEPLTAADAVSALGVFGAIISEALSATDSYPPGGTYAMSLSDALTAAASQASTASMAASIVEAATATDFLSATLWNPNSNSNDIWLPNTGSSETWTENTNSNDTWTEN